MLLSRRLLFSHQRFLSRSTFRNVITRPTHHHIHTTHPLFQSATTMAGPDIDWDSPSTDELDSMQDMFAYDTPSTDTIETIQDIFNTPAKVVRQDTTHSTRLDNVLGFGDLRDQVYKEILDPETTRGVLSNDLPALDRILKGHRLGELTIVTGPTGGGKTTVMSQLSLDYCKSGVPTLWGSFEIMNQRLAKKMLYQFAEKDLSLYPDELDKWGDQFQKLPLYFLKFFSSTAIGRVLEACQQAVDKYGVQHIILDNLQFMLSQQGNSSVDKWELQDRAIHELRSFATTQNVHISLVVHPRKDPGEQMDINSVFGSAKVTQEADNVIILQKEGLRGVRYIDIKKNRYDGTTGIVPYTFDRDSLKIRACTEEEMGKLSRESSSSFGKPLSNGSQSTLQRISSRTPFRSRS
ncbi:P-loop containing nucleoside triphosphate hydrolase protein [Chlamydoabsidia padenii]|nr:P-loop containing nucleoside triphosphate hydrolase protein [Chlamydoabsidia padenii]